ncbi:MAG: phage protein Gp36 family protein [Chlorobiaceae bacterium]
MYATLTDFQARLKNFFDQLYADKNGVVDTEAALNDLIAAQAEIDAAAAVRYAVPVTAAESQPLLQDWNLTIAEEKAWGNSSIGKTPENTENRAKGVREQLKRLAKRELVLRGAAELSGTESVGGAVIVESAEPVFTREKMQGW